MRLRISAVAKKTGLSIDNIRVWERRYGLVRPHRDSAGVREYGDEDIERLELASSATRLGFPIGRIARLSNAEIRHIIEREEATELAAAGRDSNNAITSAVLSAIERFEFKQAEASLNAAALLIDPETFVLDVLTPLMHEVGERWASGRFTVAQEHLISQLVRNLVGNLARLRTRGSAGTMLFATPAGEMHEFGIALAASLAGMHGIQTCVLGADVPIEDLLQAADRIQPSAVVLASMSGSPSPALARYLKALDKELPAGVHLVLGGPIAGSKQAALRSSRVFYAPTLQNFTSQLSRYAGR